VGEKPVMLVNSSPEVEIVYNNWVYLSLFNESSSCRIGAQGYTIIMLHASLSAAEGR